LPLPKKQRIYVSLSFNKIKKQKKIAKEKYQKYLLPTNKTHSNAIMLELCLYPCLKEMMNSCSINFLQASHLQLDTLLENLNWLASVVILPIFFNLVGCKCLKPSLDCCENVR
jgi:hypothetical protein